jgi:hypothetical protein
MTTVIGKSQELSAMTIKVALQFSDGHVLNHRIIFNLLSVRGAQMIKRLYFYSVTFFMSMDKLVQFLKNYRRQIIVGALFYIFLIFRDLIKSFF